MVKTLHSVNASHIKMNLKVTLVTLRFTSEHTLKLSGLSGLHFLGSALLSTTGV